jgi:hypothetical protein
VCQNACKIILREREFVCYRKNKGIRYVSRVDVIGVGTSARRDNIPRIRKSQPSGVESDRPVALPQFHAGRWSRIKKKNKDPGCCPGEMKYALPTAQVQAF